MAQMASLIAPLHLLGQVNQNDVQHDFLDILSMALLHSLGQDNRHEGQHDFFGYVMLLALLWASHDSNGIVNGTIAFLRSRQN